MTNYVKKVTHATATPNVFNVRKRVIKILEISYLDHLYSIKKSVTTDVLPVIFSFFSPLFLYTFIGFIYLV